VAGNSLLYYLAAVPFRAGLAVVLAPPPSFSLDHGERWPPSLPSSLATWLSQPLSRHNKRTMLPLMAPLLVLAALGGAHLIDLLGKRLSRWALFVVALWAVDCARRRGACRRDSALGHDRGRGGS
jgi:hypothetical protein